MYGEKFLDNMTIKTYKMSTIHRIILLIIFIFTIFFGCVILFMYDNTIIDIIELIIVFIILYVIAFVYVQEVIIDSKNIEFKTLLKKLRVNIKQINYIKGCVSSKSWVTSFYDKGKAKNYFYIRFKNKPLTILMFSALLSNYHELYNFLKKQ